MRKSCATNPGCIGLGLEEDTGVVVANGHDLELIGSGVVTTMDGQGCSSANIHLIRPGEPLTIRDLHILSAGERHELPVQHYLHR